MITIDEFKRSACNTPEWWHRHKFHEPIVLEDELGKYREFHTVETAVTLLNELNPDKTIAEWERS